MSGGKVYLVGAGPGDPELISVKGLKYLERAEVVVYDRLLDERLLATAPDDAELVYVGKTTGEHTRTQEEINRILVDKGKSGKQVVRLKGGDPFVFGRGGEEAEALHANSIPFEIVPGITSAVAVPAHAGIPVTHRGVASSFAVITGHEDPTKPDSAIHWDKLAGGVDTLVFLMGMQNLPEIVGQLVANGRAATTPVAVIHNGTRPGQTTVTGTLADIVDLTRERGLGPPAIVVVGEVVRLRDKLAWFDCRPLFGKRVLVTRSRSQASALSRLLAEHGAEPVELPAIDILPAESTADLDAAIAKIDGYQWLVFTSTNGVDAFFGRLGTLGKDARSMGSVRLAAIGPATATALATHGIVADIIPEVYTGEGLVTALAATDIAGKRVLLPRTDIADEELGDGLSRLGATVDEVLAYRTVTPTESVAKIRDLLTAGEVDAITFASSSTVTNLTSAINGDTEAVNQAVIACIGPKTARTAVEAGLRVDVVAGEQTIPGLVAALEDHFAREVND